MKKYLSVLVAFILVVTQFTFLGFGNAAKEGIVYVYSSNIFGPESDKFKCKPAVRNSRVDVYCRNTVYIGH